MTPPRVNLYSHQLEAIDKLGTGSILVGGVGTGKSRTALAYFYNKVCDGECLKDNGYFPKHPRSLYIITTARKRDTNEWDAEMRAFGLSRFNGISVCGIHVTIDSWNNIGKYVDVFDSFFIFDEQRVVGSGEWSKHFITIAKANDWIMLSATPGDTWMDYVPVFIANGFYKNRTQFIRRHVVYSRFAKYPKVERYLDCGHLVKLRDKILVPMDYKRKTVRHVEDRFVTYDKALYDEIIKNRWDIYKDEPIQNASSMCYAARRLVNSDPSRVTAVYEIAKAHPRLIIFYNYDYELELLRNLADRYAIPYSEWNGHRHEKLLTTERWFYICQYSAASEGWNCITTDTVVFFSMNYSYKITTQASGRIDRLNTPFTDLYYYRLRSRSSIDSAIANTLKTKKNFNEAIFARKNGVA